MPAIPADNRKDRRQKTMTMLAGGKWIDCGERNPEKYGKYRVICLKRGQRTEDEYLWNGGYWVTPGGSPSKGVQAWWEQPAAEEKRELTAGTAGKALSLADYEARIHLYKEQIGTGYIGIGRTLIEAKEAKVVPHGQWETWMTETTGLTVRQAQRCMQAAMEIRDGSALARLEMSKALMLLGSGLEEDEREQIAQKAAEEGATVKALREEIRQTKLKLVQETGATEEIRQQLARVKAERESLEAQMKATAEAYRKRLDEAEGEAYRRGMADKAEGLTAEIRKEFQNKIDFINGERAGAKERIRELEDKLKQTEKAGSARWDAGFKAGIARGEEQREMLQKGYEEGTATLQAEARRAEGLRNDLAKERQYNEELRKELERQKEAATPADFARDREILLAAAEEAEKRAADAEAELEALRASGAGQPDPVWKTLKVAAERFMADCELMTLDPAELMKDRQRIRANVEWIGSWVDAMRKALDAAVPAEGAVE